MDRRYSQDKDTKSGSTVRDLYRVSTSLGLGTKAQVCPLLITDNSEVEVAFRGTNTFYAGVNGCTVTSGNVYTSSQSGGGFAGIQVDRGSTLTIQQSNGSVFAYGGHYVAADNSNNVSNNTLYTNDDIGYGWPAGAQTDLAGGAGIGGGVTYNTTSSYGRSYTTGPPGTIIINGGEIHAFGGHQAAGIGDGDSLQDQYTGQYSNSYSIHINGGTVTAVGELPTRALAVRTVYPPV